MSYCRWSTDDFACDVYAYEDVAGGYTVHLAGSRYVGKIPKMDWGGFEADRIDIGVIVRQCAEQDAFLRACERRPIDLPHAGESFHEPDFASFKARLLGLRALGYRFPDEVLARIDMEIAEVVDGEVPDA